MLNLTKPPRGSRPEHRHAWDTLMEACVDLTRQWVFEQILVDVETVTAVRRKALLGRGSKQKVVHARWACWWMLREVLHMTYHEIGTIVGRDHSTVIHAMHEIKGSAAWVIVNKLVALQSERAREVGAAAYDEFADDDRPDEGDAGVEPFCACGRIVSLCDGSRAGCSHRVTERAA
jgi:hypothetical protein